MINRFDAANHVRSLITESIAVKQRLLDGHIDEIVAVANTLAESLAAGGKVLLCGNGGSAADAQHLAAELLVRLRPHVNRAPLPALALAPDTSSITGHGNDYEFDSYYARMVQGLGRPGDVLLGITTSGKSGNVIQAFEAAHEKQMTTVGLLGSGGGPALPLCDLSVVVPSDMTGRIQESHITIGHAIMELVEEILLQNGTLGS